MCIKNDYTYIHFINYHNKKFIDNTLGEWSSLQDYHFIRWVYAADYYNITNIFIEYAKELRENLSWWVRLTSNETF